MSVECSNVECSNVECSNKKPKTKSKEQKPLLTPVNDEFDNKWLTQIFEYRLPTEKEALKLRSYCKLFAKVLKPLPTWMEFPNNDYTSLNLLFQRFDGLARKGSSNIPDIVFFKEGQHVIKSYSNCREDYNYLTITRSIKFIGKSRGATSISGGLKLRPPSYHPKNGKGVFRHLNGWMVNYPVVEFSLVDITLLESLGHGIWGLKGTQTTLDCVDVCGARADGLSFEITRGNTMKNCGVKNCYGSGIECSLGATLMIDGEDTFIEDNCQSNFSYDYGINSIGADTVQNVTQRSRIFAAPHLDERSFLESICKNNRGGGNIGYSIQMKLNHLKM